MSDLQHFLSTLPIFSFFNRAELTAIQDLFLEVSFEKGETICKVGDDGDTFYVVLNGELEVWGGSQGERLVNTLGPRDFFGEMVLLQGGKRTATIRASRRTRLLSLHKRDFDRFFLSNPKAIEYFTRVLCKRLASATKGEGARRTTGVISVLSRPGVRGKTLVASSLAAILRELTESDVLLVTVRPGPKGPHGAHAKLVSDDLEMSAEDIRKVINTGPSGVTMVTMDISASQTKEAYGRGCSNLVSKMTDHCSFIIFDLGAEPYEMLESVGSFSDIVVDVVEQPDQKTLPGLADSVKRFRVINLFNPTSKPIWINSCEPYVIPKDPMLSDARTAAEYIRENGRSKVALPLYRMARKILGSTVGMALGGGAAFGIAHLGVLRVLEQNGIPIDIVAGCSQGAIVGVGYAAGIDTEEMIAIAHDLGRLKNFFSAMDLTFTKPGILGGNRVIEIFSPLLKGRDTFKDLYLPCKTIATDIESGERVAMGTGRLDHAFRASSSVPMVFAPLKWGDHALVDGGVADPCPAEVVREMGADICVAVNVVPPLKKGVENVVSRLYHQINRFNPLSYLGDSATLPSLFDIVMNSMQILQYELGNFKAISADILINPDLTDFTWVEYYRAAELIQRGEEAAERVLPALQKALRDKVGAVPKKSFGEATASVA